MSGQATGEATGRAHPAWCSRRHADTAWPVHEAQPGPSLELSHEVAFAVLLQRVADSPTEVILARHFRHQVTVTRLTPLTAGILRDLLTEALEVLAGGAERQP